MDYNILIGLISQGLSTHKIAKTLNCSQSNVRYWLRKLKLKTDSNWYLDKKEIKFCPSCKTDKDIKNFYKRCRGGQVAYCKICSRNQATKRQRALKIKCIEYKGGKCNKCDYNDCIAAMDFHHKVPGEKDFCISQYRKALFTENIKKELDKCELLCCRCHRELHSFRL
jgi:predicted transcriptional regulator